MSLSPHAVTSLLAGLFLAVVSTAFMSPHLYLAPDSFIYFTMARQVSDTGLLFSFSGVDHTTGVHPLYYALLSALYPFFGLSLPAWSFVINGLAVIVGVFLLYRALGAIVAVVALLIMLTPWGLSLSNNGVESSLVFVSLALATWFIEKNKKSETPLIIARIRANILFGIVLGIVVLARFDSIFFSFFLGALVSFREGIRASFHKESLLRFIRGSLITGAVVLLVLAPALFSNWYYDSSVVPISGKVKSSFPLFKYDWVTSLLNLKTFILALLLTGVFLLREVILKRESSILIGSLFLGTGMLWLYNGLFVSNIGGWYGAVPFFAILITLGLTAKEFLPSREGILSGLLCVGIISVMGLHFFVVGEDWISPHRDAALFLDSTRESGDAAAELKDGEFAFYSTSPVYNLTGLANNTVFVEAVVAGKLREYFLERHVEYVVGGAVSSGVQVRGGEGLLVDCKNPLYDTGTVQIYRTPDCF